MIVTVQMLLKSWVTIIQRKMFPYLNAKVRKQKIDLGWCEVTWDCGIFFFTVKTATVDDANLPD